MKNISYDDLVSRYGSVQAYDLLLTVERLAKIQNEKFVHDEDDRFQNALDAISKIDFSLEPPELAAGER